ncbi:MAG: glycosyltransferase family 4 protein [Planctomycetaceae bacterium]|nr:glycosyltransferase family 4 protein [Planctomycetaceae bacterium]
MRIAMLSWESLYSVAVGGVAVHVSELAQALTRGGHEVHVFTRTGGNQLNHEVIDAVHYHRCRYAGHRDFVDDVNNMCRAFVDRVFELEDLVGHFDIVHAHDWLTANAMIWIKQGRPDHRCILTIHATEYARCGNVFHNGRSQRVRDQERAGTYWADHVIAVSQATAGEIQWMYEVPAAKVSKIYNGVTPDQFDFEIDVAAARRAHDIGPMDPTILYCGRLVWQKGPDLLLEAFGPILRHYSNAKLILAGDGEMRGGLENRARQCGLAHAVRFLGYRSGQDLRSLFKLADVVCVPSRNEPFGIVVLEAWSAHKPVVVTQCGGPNEYVQHEQTGLKIFPRPDSVAWGLGTMFANFDRARWMGANGRRVVEEQFTWPQIAAQTLAVFDPAPAAGPAAPVLQQGEHGDPHDTKATVATPPAQTPEPAAPAAATDPAPRRATCRVEADLSLRAGRVAAVAAQAALRCQEALLEAGFSVHFSGRRATIEGDWDRVLAVMNRCYDIVSGADGTTMTVTVRVTPSDNARRDVRSRTKPAAMLRARPAACQVGAAMGGAALEAVAQLLSSGCEPARVAAVMEATLTGDTLSACSQLEGE